MNEAVIFDMDGVIFDSEQVVRMGWNDAAQKLGLEDIDTLYFQCIGRNLRNTEEKLCKHFGPQFSYGEFSRLTRNFFRDYINQKGLPVKCGARELLTYLSWQNGHIGMASSSGLPYIRAELQQAGLIKYFSVIVSGDNLEHSKPEPDIYLNACMEMGVTPSETYAIEDSYSGILSASRAGMKPIMVPDLQPPTAEMRRLCTVICEDLRMVQTYFERNC